MVLSNQIGEGNVITERGESFKHFLAKCILHKLIINKGSRSKIEYNAVNRIIDVVQILGNGNMYGYELQSKGIKKKSQEMMACVELNSQIDDIKVIDLSKLSSDYDQMVIQLKEMII